MSKKIIYIDIDDTLADTSNYIVSKFNIKTFTMENKKLFLMNLFSIVNVWFKIKKDPKFWEELPLKKDALLIYAKAKQISSDIHILTALPFLVFDKNKLEFQQAAQAKKNWIKLHFPEIPEENIHVCYAKEKHLVINSIAEDFILIDDSKKNIKRWSAAGGIGILVEKESSSHLFKMNTFTNFQKFKTNKLKIV